MSIRNLSQWQAALKQHEQQLQRVASDAVYHAAIKARDRVTDRIPPGGRGRFPGYAATGRMKTTFGASTPMRVGNEVRSRMGIIASARPIDRIKAYVHEYGKVIRARRAPYLVFQVQGKWVSVKQVTIRPKRFFAEAWAETLRAGRSDIEQYIREHWKG